MKRQQENNKILKKNQIEKGGVFPDKSPQKCNHRKTPLVGEAAFVRQPKVDAQTPTEKRASVFLTSRPPALQPAYGGLPLPP
jgi:hypothetical protein